MKCVKLVSGGIDSYIMSQQFDGINVYVDFGQEYAEVEQKALRDLEVDFDCIKIDCKFKNDEIYIPDRNLTLASLVAMIYNPDVIMIAGLKDDNCIDKNPQAFEHMSETLTKYANKTIKVVSPYFDMTKADIIASFNKPEKLSKTFSCYNPTDGNACGNCPACLRKVIALETNGIDSGIVLKDEILNVYMRKIHTYDKDRISRFFIYLKSRGKKVTAVDIDGVLCEESDLPYDQRKPITSNIDKINKLDSIKVLYTARLDMDREVTENWLKENNVKYDCLILNKLPFTTLIDDRAVNI